MVQFSGGRAYSNSASYQESRRFGEHSRGAKLARQSAIHQHLASYGKLVEKGNSVNWIALRKKQHCPAGMLSCRERWPLVVFPLNEPNRRIFRGWPTNASHPSRSGQKARRTWIESRRSRRALALAISK